MVSQEDRVLGAAVNLAAIPFPYVGPIVGLIVGGRSPFVRYHAFRCLIEQVLATILLALIMIASLTYSIVTLVQSGVFANGIDWSKIDWLGILIKSVATWVGLALWNLWNVVHSIRAGLAAYLWEPIRPPGWSERKAAHLAGGNIDPLAGRN